MERLNGLTGNIIVLNILISYRELKKTIGLEDRENKLSGYLRTGKPLYKNYIQSNQSAMERLNGFLPKCLFESTQPSRNIFLHDLENYF